MGRRDLLGSSRGTQDIAFARQLSMYLVCTQLDFGVTFTGKLFKRDRTTITHACHLIEDLRDDPTWEARLQRLETRLEPWHRPIEHVSRDNSSGDDKCASGTNDSKARRLRPRLVK